MHMNMIDALKDIDDIVREISRKRLEVGGVVDGRIVKGIVTSVLKTDKRRDALRSQLSEKESLIAEKDRMLADKDASIMQKDNVINEQQEKLSAYEKRISDLEKELARYKEYYGKTASPTANSQNSSVPPSKNPLSAPRTQSLRKPSGRKSGGQKGHKGCTHEFSETPDELVACPMPRVCPVCGQPLDPCGISVCERRQVIDIPLPVLKHIKEYVQHQVTCSCGHRVKGIFPDEARATVCFGENIQALVAYLSTTQVIPMKRMTDILGNMFGIEMSQGSVSNILNDMRKRAKRPYEEIRKAIEQAEVTGADETGMRVNGETDWMWTFQTSLVTFLHAAESRKKEVVDGLFPGGLPKTILVTDRLISYFNLNVADHQVCLAHLLRNTTFFEQLLPESDWPKRMLELLRGAIHQRKTEYTGKEHEEKYKADFDKLIAEEVEIEDEERRRLFATFRRGLDKHREHIFLFISHHNVPYDNNASERALRPVKTKMKVSGQFRSEDGAKNYATLMTIAETAKKNGQNPFFALRELAHYHPEQ